MDLVLERRLTHFGSASVRLHDDLLMLQAIALVDLFVQRVGVLIISALVTIEDNRYFVVNMHELVIERVVI